MSEKTRVQIFIAMNEDGDWAVHTTAHEASELLLNDSGALMIRIAVIDVQMTPPRLNIDGEVDIPNEAGETTKVEASSGDLPEASRSSHHSG
jgi:hypothetical protein